MHIITPPPITTNNSHEASNVERITRVHANIIDKGVRARVIFCHDELMELCGKYKEVQKAQNNF